MAMGDKSMGDFGFDPRKYKDARHRFGLEVNKAAGLSTKLNGSRSNHGREFWSSILFAKLVLSALTVNKILPNRPSRSSRELWDLASIATLVRGMAENYLMLYWLCTETENADLWDLRITLLTMCDNRARYRMTAELEGEPEPTDFANAQFNLSQHLWKNSLFTALPENRKKSLIKADKFPFIQDEVISCLVVNKDLFRRYYRYLSSFVHTGTISFFRMQEQRRGGGEFNDYDANAMGGAMELAILALKGATVDVKSIHGL